jgi:hypothetical protein
MGGVSNASILTITADMGLSTALPNREEGEPIPHLIGFWPIVVFADNYLTPPRGRLPLPSGLNADKER